jgi:hypothetical protein
MKAEREIAYRVDPALWVRKVVGVTPAAWQKTFLLAPRGASILALTARQAGKTTTAAWGIAHTMLFYPGSLSVVACPAQQPQSAEAIRRVRDVLVRADVKFKTDNVYGLELDNGSRVRGLPGSDESIRGLTVDGWIVADEAARVSDDLIAGLRPMRARRPDARFAMLSTAWSRTDPFWTAWVSDDPTWIRLKATADSDPTLTPTFLEQERRALGEHVFNREYLGIPGSGNASPFTWDMYERATGVHAPMVPPGSAFPLVPDDPAHWPIKYLLMTHDVGRTNDRSTAVVGGYSLLVPNELVVKEIVELPQGYFGHQLAGALIEVDARYDHNVVIVPDLSNDASYAEVLFDAFGKRVQGVQISAAGDGTAIETRILKNGLVRVYRVGRSFLLDGLLQKFRAGQIRLIDGPMARKAYEQLNALEFERTEDRVRYICPPGQHDDLAVSLAMLAWAADHPHFMQVWVRPIEDRHRPKTKVQKYGMKSFVVG